MMTYTAYDPKKLEQWCTDTSNSQIFDQQLDTYIEQYAALLRVKSQRKYFATFLNDWTYRN